MLKMIRHRSGGRDIKNFEHEINLKSEICNLIHHYQKLRMDFLLDNFIEWYKIFGASHCQLNQINNAEQASNSKKNKNLQKYKNKEEFRTRFIADLEEEIATVLPDLTRTGIDEIDNRYKPEDKNLLKFLSLEDQVENPRFKRKKFTIYK